MWGNIAIAFLLAFIVSFMATPYTIKIANKIGAVDVPRDKRRMHTKKMPKFGGPAVILGFVVSIISSIFTPPSLTPMVFVSNIYLVWSCVSRLPSIWFEL